MTTSETSTPLYARDFGSRPLTILGAGVVGAVACAALAMGVSALRFGLVAFAVIALGAGIAGWARSTTRLEVTPGQVTRHTPIGTRTYTANSLALREQGKAFVLSAREKSTSVVCVIADPDADRVRDAFAAAGVELVTDSVDPA
jgi:hypothetical protein